MKEAVTRSGADIKSYYVARRGLSGMGSEELRKRLRELKRERKMLEDEYFRSWFRGCDMEKGIIYTASAYPTEEELALESALEELDFEIEQIEELMKARRKRR